MGKRLIEMGEVFCCACLFSRRTYEAPNRQVDSSGFESITALQTAEAPPRVAWSFQEE